MAVTLNPAVTNLTVTPFDAASTKSIDDTVDTQMAGFSTLSDPKSTSAEVGAVQALLQKQATALAKSPDANDQKTAANITAALAKVPAGGAANYGQLIPAVKAFQGGEGLVQAGHEADGVVGKQTYAALLGVKDDNKYGFGSTGGTTNAATLKAAPAAFEAIATAKAAAKPAGPAPATGASAASGLDPAVASPVISAGSAAAATGAAPNTSSPRLLLPYNQAKTQDLVDAKAWAALPENKMDAAKYAAFRQTYTDDTKAKNAPVGQYVAAGDYERKRAEEGAAQQARTPATVTPTAVSSVGGAQSGGATSTGGTAMPAGVTLDTKMGDLRKMDSATRVQARAAAFTWAQGQPAPSAAQLSDMKDMAGTDSDSMTLQEVALLTKASGGVAGASGAGGKVDTAAMTKGLQNIAKFIRQDQGYDKPGFTNAEGLAVSKAGTAAPGVPVGRLGEDASANVIGSGATTITGASADWGTNPPQQVQLLVQKKAGVIANPYYGPGVGYAQFQLVGASTVTPDQLIAASKDPQVAVQLAAEALQSAGMR